MILFINYEFKYEYQFVIGKFAFIGYRYPKLVNNCYNLKNAVAKFAAIA